MLNWKSQSYEYCLKNMFKLSITLIFIDTVYENIQENLKGYRYIGNTYKFFRCSSENANHMNMVWNMFNRALDHIENIQRNLKELVTWS